MSPSQRKHKRPRRESINAGSESASKIARLKDALEPSHSDSSSSGLRQPLVRESDDSCVTIDLDDIDSTTKVHQSRIIPDLIDLTLEDVSMELDPINVDFEQLDSILMPTVQPPNSFSRVQETVSLSDKLGTTSYNICFGMVNISHPSLHTESC